MWSGRIIPVTSPPDSSIGNDGDFAIDLITGKVYTRTLGVWSEFSGALSGTGDPNSAVDGDIGAIYVDKVAPYSIWVKTTVTGILTGWIMKIE